MDNELQRVRELLDANPGYGLLLAGHSLGAGERRVAECAGGAWGRGAGGGIVNELPRLNPRH